MRSLEIRTERIFNNLIKQNQKLAADFVRKQSKIVLSAQSPTSSVKSPEFSVHSPTSRVQRPGFRVQHLEFNVQSPTPECSVQSPASSVQSSTSRVQRPTLASRVQEFRYADTDLLITHLGKTFKNKQINVILIIHLFDQGC